MRNLRDGKNKSRRLCLRRDLRRSKKMKIKKPRKLYKRLKRLSGRNRRGWLVKSRLRRRKNLKS